MARPKSSVTPSEDRTPPRSGPDAGAAAELLQELKTEARAFFKGRSTSAPFPKPDRFKAGRAILAAAPETKAAFVRECMKLTLIVWYARDEFYTVVQELRDQLLTDNLQFTDEDVMALADWIGTHFAKDLGIEIWALTAIERYAKDHELSPASRERLEALRTQLRQADPFRAGRAAAARIGKLLGNVPFWIDTGEAWSDAALAEIEAMTPETYRAWSELLASCQKAGAGQPSARWMKVAVPLVDAVGRDDLKARLLRWFPLVDRPRTEPREASIWEPAPNDLIEEHHVHLLKGLAWLAGLDADRELARSLGALALSSYRSIPEKGPRLVLLGNAAVWALGAMPGRDGIGQLALLKLRIRQLPLQAQIGKALAAAAEREDLPAADLEEMCVPTYGLVDVGRRREVLGDYAVELVLDTGATELRWSKADDGTPLASAPAAAKKLSAATVKEMQALARDAGKMQTAQRDRIDRLFLERKTWDLGAWRERYLDHPVVGVIARRLIWQFRQKGKSASGAWLDGRLVDANDRPLTSLRPSTTVELWHPIDDATESVMAWRDWLERHQVRQPFKQAHRELYLLTDAERATRTYSNRFAAHIVRHHQYHALCGLRGWRDQLRLMVAGEYPPTSRGLPGWDLRAEFLIEGLGTDPSRDLNPNGTFRHLTTHQVRFLGIDERPVPLERVPPLVLTEILRDVDLFVGVASVGNDPNWVDGGPYQHFRQYVRDFRSAELTPSGETRKSVLERLVPRLKIADRCSFTDRYLVVRGDLHTYRIHLGSGNIFIEPKGTYLCIVPKANEAATEGIFLPFDGDETLSIILSKAFLLADDSRIRDRTILSQMNR